MDEKQEGGYPFACGTVFASRCYILDISICLLYVVLGKLLGRRLFL